MAQTHRLAAAYGALLLLTAFGLFTNLDDRLLWGDEAETAVLAVNITQFGVPVVDDGRNVIANLRARGDSNEAGIWTWSPWLDEYLAAGSFLAFGPSTLAARLPFAAIALLAALALARLAFRLTSRHEVALIALALFATSVPLLLHARQARYYAVLMLAEVWLLHGLSLCLRGDKGPNGRSGVGRSGVGRSRVRHSVAGALQVAASLAALFYCNYIVVPGNLIAIAGLGGVIWLRERQLPRAFVAGVAGFAALAAPWILYSPPGGQLRGLGFQHFSSSLAYYTSEIHHHFVPWLVLALPIAAFALRRSRGERLPPEPRASADLETFVWFLMLASLLVYSLSPLRFFRYLVPLVPPLFLLVAILISNHVRPAWARGVLVGLLAFSNAVAVAGAPMGSHPLEFPYSRFARSITTAYDERLDDVLTFLAENSEPGQSLWVADPEFPLMFYTDLRIIDARYHRFPEDPPDWVFATSASGIGNRRPLQLPAGVRTLYSESALKVKGSRRGGSRPDPHAREWFQVGGWNFQKMRIYRKR